MAKIILNEITNEVREAGEFAVLSDEGKDCRKTEQLSLQLCFAIFFVRLFTKVLWDLSQYLTLRHRD